VCRTILGGTRARVSDGGPGAASDDRRRALTNMVPTPPLISSRIAPSVSMYSPAVGVEEPSA